MVAKRAPEAPSGCPIAIAPPFGLVISGSAPVSASHAPTTDAKASVDLECTDVIDGQAYRLSTISVAGIGPVSIMIGSDPATAPVWKRAIGVKLKFGCLRARSDEQCSGTIGNLRRVSGRHDATLFERGWQGRELLNVRAGADSLVSIEVTDGNDLFGEESISCCGGGARAR